jgi:hypothetical protein
MGSLVVVASLRMRWCHASKDRIRHVIADYRVRFEEPPPDTEGARASSTRVVHFGDDDHGRALEVMASLIRRYVSLGLRPLPTIAEDPLASLSGSAGFEPADIDETVYGR